MTNDWLKSFTDNLVKTLDKPPYLLFFFSGTIFVAISLTTKFAFEQTWVFFIYSAVGTIWRYIEKDFIRPLGEMKKKDSTELRFPNAKLCIIIAYHLGNIVLLLALLNKLNLI